MGGRMKATEKRVVAAMKRFGAQRVKVKVGTYFNEPELYTVARQRDAAHSLYCYGKVRRDNERNLLHLPAFTLLEMLLTGDDMDAAVEAAIFAIAAVTGENDGQLFAESFDVAYRDMVEFGETCTTADRTYEVDGKDLTLSPEHAAERQRHLDLDSMMLGLRFHDEAAHTPGCLLCVWGMPAEAPTETDGQRVEIYSQVPDNAPIELANIYVHRGDDTAWPTIDVGVGVERCIMRHKGITDISEVKL